MSWLFPHCISVKALWHSLIHSYIMKENGNLGGQIFIKLLYNILKFYTLSCLILTTILYIFFPYCLDRESKNFLGYIFHLNSCWTLINSFFISQFSCICRNIFSLFYEGISLAPKEVLEIFRIFKCSFMPISGERHNKQYSISIFSGCHLKLWSESLSVAMPGQITTHWERRSW